MSVFGARKLAARYRRGFPRSLDGAPFLLPTSQTALRRSVEDWFDSEGIRPAIQGEFDDAALLKTFGQAGVGLFVASSVIEPQIRQQYGVQRVGRLDDVHERFYAISVERRLKHPAVIAISESAREKLVVET